MKEQSHKNEMSAAIRGDFQRLRDRGVAATLAPRPDEAPAPPATADLRPELPELVEVARPPVAVSAVALDACSGERAGAVAVAPFPAPVEGRPGIFSRLLGRG